MMPIPPWRRNLYVIIGIALSAAAIDVAMRVWIGWEASAWTYDLKYQPHSASMTAHAQLKEMGIRAVPHLVDALSDPHVKDHPARQERIVELLYEITGREFGLEPGPWRAWMQQQEIRRQIRRSPLEEKVENAWRFFISKDEPPPAEPGE